MSNSSISPPKGRRSSLWTAWLLPAILGAASLGLALAIRFLWIENREFGLACGDVPAPWWCALREAAWHFHQWNGWGLTALAAGAIGLLFRLYPLALIGLVFGLFGIVLYNAGLAAVGLLAALLLIVRR